MNPPFNDSQRQNVSPDAATPARARRHARHAAALDRGRGLAAAAGGMLTLIWRADGLAEVLAALSAGFGSVAVLPVYPRPDAAGDSRAGARGQRRHARR